MENIIELEEKFTKGNWYFQTDADVYTNIVRCNNELGYDSVYIVNCHGSNEENHANATLISAAPDLLNALKMMLSRFENVDVGMIKADFVRKIARNAIEKALTIQEKSTF